MTLRPALASALLTLLACRGAPSQPAGQRAAGKVAEVKTAENIEVSDDPCPSWDELDLERLAPLPQGGDPSTMEAFERAWDVVRRKFPDPTLGCRDWPALRAEYGAAIARTSGQEEAYDLLNEMLSKLGVSHLHATPPTGLAQQLRPTGTGTLGISWELVDDPSKWRVLVRSLGEDRASWAGLELVELGGRSVDEALVPGDPFETSRRIEILTRCPVGERIQVIWRTPKGAKSEARPCLEPEGEPVSLGAMRDLPTRVTHGWVGPEGDGIAWLSFNIWMLPMLPRIRESLDALRDRGLRALILDLRGNPGGVGAMVIPMGRELFQDGADLGRLRMRGFDQALKVAPNPDAFIGPVRILLDERSASTTEIFALALQEQGRARVVASRGSAGMALPSLIETLPDGGSLQVAVGDYTTSGGAVAEGDGVRPDVLVEIDSAGLAEAGDLVMAAAAEDLAREFAEKKPRG